MEKERRTYTKMNHSDDTVVIDLKNGYSVMAVSGFDKFTHTYTTTLFLSKNGYDCWKIIEDAKDIVFHASVSTINSAVLKHVCELYDAGKLNTHIERYEFMLACVDSFYSLLERAPEGADDEE